MEESCLQFHLEAFGGPVYWNARSAYLTWNRRVAQQFVVGQYPETVKERLADFYSFLHNRKDSARRPLSMLFEPPQQKRVWLVSAALALVRRGLSGKGIGV